LHENHDPRFCIVCEGTSANGLEILGKNICPACEREIVECQVDDDRYGYYVLRLKALLIG
jgi:hypothetical protein